MSTLDTNKLLSDITVYGKYARHLDSQDRREDWGEIIQRNADMHAKTYPDLADEIYKVFATNVMNKKIFPSMRSLQFAGPAIERSPSRLYNCSYLPVDHYKAFSETMFLLLGGSGVGISVQDAHICKLPFVQGTKKRVKRFLVADNIEGWADAIKVLMDSYFFNKMDINFDYSDIRPKGAYLVTAGGKAPGPQPLKDAIHNIRKVLDCALEHGPTRLTSVEIFDIMCHISDAVLAGGIRRSAIITLFDANDSGMLSSKSGPWYELNPQRGRSNNSAVIYRDSENAYEQFKTIWKHTQDSGAGEPGIVFSDDINYGMNPCAEISLKSFGFCNLTEVSVDDVETQEELNERVRQAAFIGTLQAGYTDFHYLRDVWRENAEEEALIGVGMTGIGSGNILKLDLKEAARVVMEENERVANLIGINKAKRATCIKPSGTSSLVAGTASGVHTWFNDFYIRRMRLAKNDALYQYLVKVLPSEFIEDESYDPENTGVVSIPIKAPEGSILRTEPVMDLLERTKKFNTEWVAGGHREGPNKNNVSVTVSIKDEEWGLVGEWMWANKETFTGMATLPYNGGTFPQLPFEDISKEEYNRLVTLLEGVEIDLHKVVEEMDNTDLSGEAACSGSSGCSVDKI